MIKSNSKKAIENIKLYIIEGFEGYDDLDNMNISTFEYARDYIKEAFNNEVGNYRTNQIGLYNAFREWCQGLPSVLDTCYYYNRSAIKDLGDILEETEEERNKYTEEDAEERLTQLIFREIFKER